MKSICIAAKVVSAIITSGKICLIQHHVANLRNVGDLLEISIFLADLCLTFCPFTFVHCVVCPSAIYGF
jgi:hypothetical protein